MQRHIRHDNGENEFFLLTRLMNFQVAVPQVHSFVTNVLQYKHLMEQTEKKEKRLRINLASRFTSTFIFWRSVGGGWIVPDKCGVTFW